MIYNFRIDRSQREFLKRQLQENSVLYQGWGQYDLSNDTFIEDTKIYYQLKSTRTPTSLSRIKSFKDGDVLLVPHFPEKGLVTFAVVAGNYPGCYEKTEENPHHLNHAIKVKKVYGLNVEISMYNQRLVEWYGKLSGLRLPIITLNHLEDAITGMVKLLESDPETRFGKSSMNDYLGNQTDMMVESLLDQLQRLSPSRSDLSFEKVCEDLLLRYGYDLVRRNYYNGKKGDADLVLNKKNQSHSPFEVGEYYLFVQIKKHRGETDDHAVNQLINIMEDETDYLPARGCVISLAESFSEMAVMKAGDAGIKLINGPEITKLLAHNALSQVGEE
ncbi:restriction endonuclease [Rossellomorea aquimaris]|uniref:restriction endonuclease n=1 Tax=Rossellomorea aquimaris TaxID=189382 RepID=UPI001CD2E57C|nr:restriction endonuclease [Rossellomorea aquimaris]MCA1054144.1 restriction endonuclease [Rossellomorea aquimaris]